MSVSFSEQVLTSGTTSLTTKGDILVHDGTSPIRVSVGSNGLALYANSSSTGGVYWGSAPTSPAFGMVKISTASVTADTSSVEFSNIPSTYKDLFFVAIASNTSTARTVNQLRIRFNNLSATSQYDYVSYTHDGRDVTNSNGDFYNYSTTNTSIPFYASVGNQSETEYLGYASGSIYQYRDTAKWKTGQYESMCVYNDTQDLGNSPYGWGIALSAGAFTFRSTQAITTLTFYAGSGLAEGIKSGSYFVLYGRK